jgi:hypothetical protein
MKTAAALACVLAVLALAAPYAPADWPHQVKWDQLDNPSNWSISSTINDDGETISADDFVCDETGWITDIEFWGGYTDIFALNALRVTFWDDVSATDTDESHPGTLLRWIDLTEACPCDQYKRGWQLLETNHFKINLPEQDWFIQQQGTTYWIGIQGLMDGSETFYWTLRDPSVCVLGDDAAYSADIYEPGTWLHMGWQTENEPGYYFGTLPNDWLSSADLCFRLTGTVPEPASMGLVCLIGLAVIKRRLR